jgi:dephospho-CoA kinase
MLVIGLAGGIASGKSLVASQFQSLGAVVLDADAIGHDVLRDPDVKRLIRQEWGESVFDDGEVSRRAMAEIVFRAEADGARQLKILEQITHPRIGEILTRRLSNLKTIGETHATVLDAPVMFEAGWDRICDKTVFVDAPPEQRIRRARARGWTDSQFYQREARQLPNEIKRAKCSDYVDNSTSIEATFAQVMDLWRRWELPLPNESLKNSV